jgi:hypothetical protein
MFNADFELKRIPGTDPNSEYFVVTETNGYTVGVKPFLAITPQGVVTLGLRVRANGDDPEEAAETLGLNLKPKSDKHASATFFMNLGFIGELAIAKAVEVIDAQKLVRKLSDEVLSKIKGTVGLTEKEFITSEALISVLDETKMKLKEEAAQKDFAVKSTL